MNLASGHDKRSLLACQLATRELRPAYNYLEIGSFLGGSLQTHLIDPRCARIVSVDNRAPDSHLEENTTEAMLENLGRVDGGLAKVECIEADASELDTGAISVSPDLCYIDGLHTNAAVISDFKLCREAMGDSGAVLFHDSQVVAHGIEEIVNGLAASGAEFKAYNLPDIIFVIELGDFPLHRHPQVSSLLAENYLGYFFLANWHRGLANRRPVRWVRAARRTIRFRRITTGRT